MKSSPPLSLLGPNRLRKGSAPAVFVGVFGGVFDTLLVVPESPCPEEPWLLLRLDLDLLLPIRVPCLVQGAEFRVWGLVRSNHQLSILPTPNGSKVKWLQRILPPASCAQRRGSCSLDRSLSLSHTLSLSLSRSLSRSSSLSMGGTFL